LYALTNKEIKKLYPEKHVEGGPGRVVEI